MIFVGSGYNSRAVNFGRRTVISDQNLQSRCNFRANTLKTMKNVDGPTLWFWALQSSFLCPGYLWMYSTFWWTCILRKWKPQLRVMKQWFTQCYTFLVCAMPSQILYFMDTSTKTLEKNTEIYTGKANPQK